MTDLSLRIFPNHYFCPEDGAILVKRIPRPDDDWEIFLGCRNWPECKYTRTILPDGRVEPEIYYLDDLRWIMENRDD